MGNYNGTVRCGYCGQRGHNKRSCPARLEQLQRQLQRHKDNGDSTYVGYYAREIAKMTGTNPETGASRKRRNESYGRHCSYCRERGHSRRTCPTLKEDQRNYRRMASVVRRDMLARMKEHGFGVGSLVTLNGHEWIEGEYLEVKNAYLVTGIDWGRITPHNQQGQHCVKAISVKDPSNHDALALPTEISGTEEGRWQHAPVLVGATPSEKINPPSEWLAGAGAEDNNDLFENGSRRQHFWWRHEAPEWLDRWAAMEPAE